MPRFSIPRRLASACGVPACAWLCLLAIGSGCADRNAGVDPEVDELFFPAGLLLDPRAAAGEAAKYLFVANGNNDLAFNAGTLVAVDLEAFFASWSQPGAYAVHPYCDDDDDGPCVLDVGSDVNAQFPCRRLALLPQVVECDESPFVVERQIVGDFATLLTHSCEDKTFDPTVGCKRPRLWLPIRGDPSITFLDIAGGPDTVPALDCGQKIERDPETNELIDHECASSNRLSRVRNDDTLAELPREPFNLVVSQSSRLAYVTHSDGSGLTLIDLDGIDDGSIDEEDADDDPAIVDIAPVFLDPSGTTGGFGVAERPCDPLASPPSITLDCTRPLVYVGFRYSRLLASFTVQGVEFADADVGAACTSDDTCDSRECDCKLEDGECAIPGKCLAESAVKCARAGELDAEGKINCDERVRSQRLIFPGGLDPSSTGFRPILGDVQFADAAGDELLVLQTGPGALLKMDTHVGPDGEPLDTPSVPPLELCDEPSRMHLFEDAGQRYALVACFRAAVIYVVDLQAFRVLDSIVVGTGPYELEVDDVRKLLYVANNLENSITVIDLSRDRPTRFREIARLGLQDPFSR